jgi:CRP-like cAMP-binding protein
VLHCILLPLNIFRLVQILALLRKVEAAAQNQNEPELGWLQSIAESRTLKSGEILFRKGDTADRMYYVMSGVFRVSEIGVDLAQGQILGELALLAPGKKRSQSVECISDGEILEITYDRVRQLYFQSPKFGFFFLQLATRRLFENLDRQDRELAAYRAEAKVAR